MIIIAAGWITLLLIAGGLALDRVLVNAVSDNFDDQMEYVLTAMIASAEIGPDGEVRLNRPLGDQRFLEPNSGLYWQISGKGKMPFPSRSLWDRTLRVDLGHTDAMPHFRTSDEFAGEPLRIVERAIVLPDSQTRWIFMVAQSRESLDAQITELRTVLATAFAVLAFGLIIMAALQTFYGLWPLRDVRREIAAMRSGKQHRIQDALPDEVMPMVNELNALLDHNEKQAEEARRHAGNLAHALKTPLTVIMNSATAQSPDLAETVIREATTMRRQVDHHLARARAVGRRGHSHSRAEVWQSLESVERAVGRLYRHVRLDMAGNKQLSVRVERQDLDEMIGNLVENAAKYGGGSVFVTVEDAGEMVAIIIEDDGRGIPEKDRARIFDRGVRLDSGKPGTGLGMAIVRDVAEIYNGSIELEESEDMGGLLVRLSLPKAV
ncbi:ATP-binding protein [Sphingorhabdus sp.]|uniref:sensor histidine kinase n=1 Tax=Sphingorhabdus sp. TaxID=1902408 RepID=UPI0035B29CE2|nr:sensor histidine kinase N-terminal domain-containing protein [Sphingomonadaceae bacterium]